MAKVVTETATTRPRKFEQEVGPTTPKARVRRRGSRTEPRTDRATASIRLERQGVLRPSRTTPPVPASAGRTPLGQGLVGDHTQSRQPLTDRPAHLRPHAVGSGSARLA